MADAFDCGRYTREVWSRAEEYIERWLGPYNPNMPMDEIHARLEHENLTSSFRDSFERGWRSIQLSANHSAVNKTELQRKP
jgi:hypothetical protein